MAKEWYLIKTPHAQVSGFEDDAFNDFAEEGFAEILNSEAAVNVEICNCDLSDCKPIRAIVQNTVQDTKLKSLVRTLFVPIGTCKAGMYVKYKDRYWLIVGLVDDNKMYEKAVMSLCNYKLTWVNDEGKIIQRWANVISASQYNNGETSIRFNFFNYRSDQLLIATANDDESMMIKTGMRFIIDRRCQVYEKELANKKESDFSKSLITYRVTRADSVLYDYIDSGHFEFMVTQDEQQEKDGYYVIEDNGYWLCEQSNIPAEKIETNIRSNIEADEYTVYNGLEPTIFTAKFYDSFGNEKNVEPNWEIACDFTEKLHIEYVDNSICISIDDRKLINKSFELSLSGDGYEKKTITIMIKALF